MRTIVIKINMSRMYHRFKSVEASVNYSRTVGHGHHFKFILLVLVTGLFMHSCAPTMSLNYNQAALSKGDGTSYSAIEIQGSDQIGKTPFSLGVSLTSINIYQTKYTSFEFGDDVYSDSEREIVESPIAIGIVPSYYFSFKRLQPFVGCNFNGYYSEDELRKDHFNFSLTPHVGVRYFTSNKFAFNGNVGYKMMTTYGNGFGFSLGISYRFGR